MGTAAMTSTVSNTPTASVSQTSSTSDNFDIDKVDINSLSEEVQKVIKGFQADYTKKTQALSREKNDFKSEIEKAKEWNNWYDQYKPLIDEFNQWKKDKDNGTDTMKKDGTNDMNIDDDEPLTRAELNKIREEMNDFQNQTKEGFSQGFKMLVDLHALQKNNSDFEYDPKEVIKYAQENEIADIGKAFAGRYQKEIEALKIKKAVEEEREKWEKEHLNVLGGNMPKGREVRKILAIKRK